MDLCSCSLIIIVKAFACNLLLSFAEASKAICSEHDLTLVGYVSKAAFDVDDAVLQLKENHPLGQMQCLVQHQRQSLRYK